MLYCKTCREHKLPTEFNKKHSKGRIYITTKRCKKCQNEYLIQWTKKRLELNPEYTKQFYQRRIEKFHINMMKFLADKYCMDCGESDPIVLDFDHRDPTQKLTEISNMRQKKWEVILEEITKCDVRCANCHRIKTWERRNGY